MPLTLSKRSTVKIFWSIRYIIQSVIEINVMCFVALGLCGGGKKERLEQRRQAGCSALLLLRGAAPYSPHTGGVVR